MRRQVLTEMLIEEVAPTLPPSLSVRFGLRSSTVYSGLVSSGFEYPDDLDDEAFVRDTVADLNGEDCPRVGDRTLDLHVGTPSGGPFAADPEAE